jgi:WD40 repeat protein
VLRIYDLAKGAVQSDYVVHANYAVNAVAFSPDGKHVATASTDHTALYIEHATGKIEWTMPLTLNGTVVLFTADGKHLMVESSAAQLTRFDLATGEASVVGQHLPPCETMMLSKDGKSMIVSTGGRGPRMVALADGSLTMGYETVEAITCAVFSPDGSFIASGGLSTGVYVWQLKR